MLRCIKWLPLVCPLLFLLCFGTGWIFGKPPEKVGPLPPPPIPTVTEQMTFIFTTSIYDLNGKPVPATVITKSHETGQLVPIEKQGNEVGKSQYITFRPEDTTRYREASKDIKWLNRTQFLSWLKNDFSTDLRQRGADMQKWQSILKKLETDAGNTSCNYPVVIERK